MRLRLRSTTFRDRNLEIARVGPVFAHPIGEGLAQDAVS